MLTLYEMIEKARTGDKYALGAEISPLDDRDFVQYPPAPGAPDAVTIPGVGVCPVYSQQGSTCTGYAIATCMTYIEYKETQKVRHFDGAELHHRIVPDWAAGLWPRESLDDIRARGAEGSYDASSTALYRIAGYAGVPLDPDSVLTALSTTGPVQLVTWLGEALYDQWYHRKDIYIPAPAKQDTNGLHSVTIVSASRAQGAVIQGTWGVEGVTDSTGVFGGGAPFAGIKGGFHKVSWEWLATQGAEAWAITDVKNDTGAGWIRTHSEKLSAGGFSLVKRPDRPAVYAVGNGTRDWISSQNELYARGLGGMQIQVLDKSDPVWAFPVFGSDAPEGQRA